MSKKGKRKGKAAEPRPTTTTTTTTTTVAKPVADLRSAWWFGFEISRHHLALFRLAFFGVLAIDAFFQVSHAARYGASDFNVPQLTWLPLPGPSREGMLTIQLLMAYGFAMAALGIATRVVVPIGAALNGYAYFSSQLDSYQHHYLVAMLLICACFVPWHSREDRVRSWALRLFTVQLAILYLWTVVAKLDARWLDGSALNEQLRPRWIRELVGEEQRTYATLAKLVIAGEAFLCVAWLWRRTWLWLVALFVGVGFHIGIELAGFQIGQFSFVMFAVYLLMVPAVVADLPGRLVAWIAQHTTPTVPRMARWLAGSVLGIALVGAATLWQRSPLTASWLLVVTSTALAIGAFWFRRSWSVGVAHLCVCALIALLVRHTDQAKDYYRYWAGSARRLGYPAEMKRAYLQLVELDHDHGPANYYLGKLAQEAGEPAAALDHYQRAQRGQPDVARAWIGEAQVRIQQGDREAARAALDRALRIDPADVTARQILRALDAERAKTPAEAPDGAPAPRN